MIDDRATLPQLEHRPFPTDSGLETALMFNEGVDLPSFGAFVLLETSDCRRRLRRYFDRHAQIARDAAMTLSPRGRGEYVISGCIGPRGDGYDAGSEVSAEEAGSYHAEQVASFALTEADLVSALTLTNTAEAIGITKAVRNAGMPMVVSFTLEVDGRLPSGEVLSEATLKVDVQTDRARPTT